MSGPMVIICRPSTFLLRRILHCPTCKRRRRFAVLDAAWYGPTKTCCGCGDSWTDGERHVRPFRRGWRAEAKRQAKAIWADAGKYTHEDWQCWLRAEINGDEEDSKEPR